MQLYRAKYILPISAPLIEDGVVGIEGERIAAVGRRSDFTGPFVDLGESVLMPGFINAHCHLEYTNLAGRLPFRGGFSDWIGDMIAAKRAWSAEDYAGSMREGLDRLRQTGTTSVCDITSFPAAGEIARQSTLRIYSCLELIDVSGQVVEEGLWDRWSGLAPHAPYTASRDLYRFSAAFCRLHGKLFTTHLAESAQETDMFERGEGALYHRLQKLGRPMADCGHGSAVSLLDAYGVLGNTLVVHANSLREEDIGRLARSGASVVHCPGSHRFFSHPPFPFERLRAAGVTICLGTDSAASGASLDMRAEMRECLSSFPFLKPEEVLALATTSAAKALHQDANAGRLSVGGWADMIALPMPGSVSNVAEAVIAGHESVRFSLVNGKAIAP